MYQSLHKGSHNSQTPNPLLNRTPHYQYISPSSTISSLLCGEQFEKLNSMLPDIIGFSKRLSQEPGPLTDPANIIKNLDALKPSQNDNVNVFMNVKVFMHAGHIFKTENKQQIHADDFKYNKSIVGVPLVIEKPEPKPINHISTPEPIKKQPLSIPITRTHLPKQTSQIPKPLNPLNNSHHEDTLLRKREKIDKNCNCKTNHNCEDQSVFNTLYDQQLLKIKFFWRRTNPNYPFVFKKKVLKYYVDTDEISVSEVVDYSKKIIQADDFLY